MPKSLLLELGCEELPAGFVAPAAAQLAAAVVQGLEAGRISYGSVKEFGTPRRLAVLVTDVADSQHDLQQERRGPSREIAFDAQGNPTKAAVGFARGAGIAPEQLVVRQTEQGEYVYAVISEGGRPSQEVLPELLAQAVSKLSFPKSMRWGSNDARFARPLRWIVALLGRDILSFEAAGIASGRTSRGHRVLAQTDLEIRGADDYLAVMEAGFVVADLQRRQEMIKQQVEQVADDAGGKAVVDPELLEEVTCLVEYPTALCGRFDASFLEIPQEALVTSMQEHQRYFPVTDKQGQLMPLFVTVRNGGAEYLDTVREGNEKVLSARLSDAKFFYTEDKKKPLSDNIDVLKSIVFQERLGTVFQKTERIRRVAGSLAKHLHWDDWAVDVDRTAVLCKADLVSHMVYEFPELQGVMGREYAKLNGESEMVAEGIFEHYLPRFAGDQVPKQRTGIAVGLADRIDTIVGCFAIGLIPTGSQDPYGLRRRTLGIIQTILTRHLPVRVDELIRWSIEAYGSLVESPAETAEAVHEFFDHRFKGVLSDQGFRYDLVDAVMAVERDDLEDVQIRLQALQQGAESENFARLLAGFQRAANLVDKQSTPEVDLTMAVFTEPAEKQLFDAYLKREELISELLGRREYTAVMELLAQLQDPIDQFFADVMVMAEDPQQRSVRLALLGRVVEMMTQMADLRKVAQ